MSAYTFKPKGFYFIEETICVLLFLYGCSATTDTAQDPPVEYSFSLNDSWDLFFDSPAYVIGSDNHYLYIAADGPWPNVSEYMYTKEIRRWNPETEVLEKYRSFTFDEKPVSFLVTDSGDLVWVNQSESTTYIEYAIIYEHDGGTQVIDSGNTVLPQQIPQIKSYNGSLIYLNYHYTPNDSHSMLRTFEAVKYDLDSNEKHVLFSFTDIFDLDQLYSAYWNYGLNGDVLTLIMHDDQESDLIEINLITEKETRYHLPVFVNNALSLDDRILIEIAEFKPLMHPDEAQTIDYHERVYDKTTNTILPESNFFPFHSTTYKNLILGIVRNSVHWLNTADNIQHALVHYDSVPAFYLIDDILYISTQASNIENTGNQPLFVIHIDAYKIQESLTP